MGERDTPPATAGVASAVVAVVFAAATAGLARLLWPLPLSWSSAAGWYAAFYMAFTAVIAAQRADEILGEVWRRGR